MRLAGALGRGPPYAFGRGAVRITHRNNYLYDLSNRTDVFDPESPPVAKVTWF